MDAYLKKRDELIAQDRALRPDYASPRVLSTEEQKVDRILRNIRADEALSVWNGQLSVAHLYGPQQMFPGMEFLTGKFSVSMVLLY